MTKTNKNKNPLEAPMTTFQSLPDLESSGVSGTTVRDSTGSSLFMMQLLQALAEQTVILKRINSKLWKLNNLLSNETKEDLAEYDNRDGDL